METYEFTPLLVFGEGKLCRLLLIHSRELAAMHPHKEMVTRENVGPVARSFLAFAEAIPLLWKEAAHSSEDGLGWAEAFWSDRTKILKDYLCRGKPCKSEELRATFRVWLGSASGSLGNYDPVSDAAVGRIYLAGAAGARRFRAGVGGTRDRDGRRAQFVPGEAVPAPGAQGFGD
jgi:hypothetical protein